MVIGLFLRWKSRLVEETVVRRARGTRLFVFRIPLFCMCAFGYGLTSFYQIIDHQKPTYFQKTLAECWIKSVESYVIIIVLRDRKNRPIIVVIITIVPSRKGLMRKPSFRLT